MTLGLGEAARVDGAGRHPLERVSAARTGPRSPKGFGELVFGRGLLGCIRFCFSFGRREECVGIGGGEAYGGAGRFLIL